MCFVGWVTCFCCPPFPLLEFSALVFACKNFCIWDNYFFWTSLYWSVFPINARGDVENSDFPNCTGRKLENGRTTRRTDLEQLDNWLVQVIAANSLIVYMVFSTQSIMRQGVQSWLCEFDFYNCVWTPFITCGQRCCPPIKINLERQFQDKSWTPINELQFQDKSWTPINYQ